jgi:hypothetical protein
MKSKLEKKEAGIMAFVFLFLIIPVKMNSQTSHAEPGRIVFDIHFDPVISWFRSDVKETSNEGARPGFNLGLTMNKFFTSNYAVTIGLSLINAGGRLSSSDTTLMEFSNFKSTVLPGKPVIYKVKYLSVPFGLRLQTDQIGYMTFFTNLGFDPKVVVGGNATIPSLDIKNENAIGELRMFNLGYHITGGMEYSFGGTTAFVAGLNFENNFLDVTKENNSQVKDKVTHKLLSFRLGLIF